MRHGPPRGEGRAAASDIRNQEPSQATSGRCPETSPASPERSERRPATGRAAEIAADAAFRNRVRRLHARGPRLVAELLAELGAQLAIIAIIEQKVDEYLAINDAALDLAAARELPPAPIHSVLR